MLLRPLVPAPHLSPPQGGLHGRRPLAAALAAGPLRLRVLGVALLPLLLALALPACQSRVVCNIAAAAIPAPALSVANGAIYAEGRGALSVLRAGTGALVWRSPDGIIVYPTPPLVADGTVIAATSPGTLVAFHVSDGSLAWHSQPVPRPQTGNNFARPSLALSGDIVYASASADSIAAWRLSDGILLWQSPPVAVPADPTYNSGVVPAPEPVAAGAVVYFSAGQSVRAVRAADGSLLWSSPPLQAEDLYTPPVLAGNRLFVAAQDGSLYALDAGTGAILWHAPDPGAVAASGISSVLPAPLIVRDGVVYYVRTNGVRAVAADTGALLWHLPADHSGATSSLRVVGGVVYVAGSALQALDARTGAVRWSIPIQQAPEAPFVVDHDTLYTLSTGALTAWRTSDGTRLWQHAIPPPGLPNLMHMVVAGDTVYLGTNGMGTCGAPVLPTVSALRAADGALLWPTPVPV